MNALLATYFAELVLENEAIDVSVPWSVLAALGAGLIALIVVLVTFFGRSRSSRDG